MHIERVLKDDPYTSIREMKVELKKKYHIDVCLKTIHSYEQQIGR